jgi:hypothetical protein
MMPLRDWLFRLAASLHAIDPIVRWKRASGDRSSSTMPIGALVSVSGIAAQADQQRHKRGAQVAEIQGLGKGAPTMSRKAVLQSSSQDNPVLSAGEGGNGTYGTWSMWSVAPNIRAIIVA